MNKRYLLEIKQIGGKIEEITNSREASSERNVPIVSHIALIDSGPKQFSGVLSCCPPSPWGLDGLVGDVDILGPVLQKIFSFKQFLLLFVYKVVK